MTPLDSAEDFTEKAYRDLEARTSTEHAQGFLEAARFLIAVRIGGQRLQYRKLTLFNGRPLKPDDSRPAA
jgi:hypothetical protein